MISLPKLDDQKYAEIVEAAKRRIPVIFPEWTDFNEHDPGITLIELFAWLKEMQQYTLDRIPDRSRATMLLLAGTELRRAAPAVAKIIPENAPEYLPVGSTTQSPDGAVFTLTEAFHSQRSRISGIFMSGPGGFVDVTGINSERGTVFYPFGADLDCTGKSLYIRMTDSADRISLDFLCSDRCAVARNPFADCAGAPRDIVWEYSTTDGFSPCGTVSDETHALSFSGRLTLSCGADFAECSQNAPESGFWLRARVDYPGCEDMPLLSGIFTDMLAFTQKQRECSCSDLFSADGTAELDDLLCARGKHVVMLRDEHGWYDIPEPEYTVGGSRARFSLSQYQTVSDGAENVRIISYTESFAGKMSFSSNGLPGQEFPFDPDGVLLTDEFRIMVRDRSDSEFPRWQEYSYIEDLALAGEYDRAFTYDEKRRCIVFGDNENGEAPPVGLDNILVISCALTRGAAGNISAGNLNEITGTDGVYPAIQPESCAGGSDRESLASALHRFRKQLADGERAVSAEDHRRLALRTPGLRIADVRAIPSFDPEDMFAPPEKLRNIVTLAVLPYSRSEYPMPDERFLSAVKRHMERCRLLTAELKITAPLYVRVNIRAELVCGTRETDRVTENAQKTLRRMLSVYGGDGRSRFGEPVLESRVMAALYDTDGVLAVRYLRMNVDRPDCISTSAGITIPPHAIACCGTVELTASGR